MKSIEVEEEEVLCFKNEAYESVLLNDGRQFFKMIRTFLVIEKPTFNSITNDFGKGYI